MPIPGKEHIPTSIRFATKLLDAGYPDSREDQKLMPPSVAVEQAADGCNKDRHSRAAQIVTPICEEPS